MNKLPSLPHPGRAQFERGELAQLMALPLESAAIHKRLQDTVCTYDHLEPLPQVGCHQYPPAHHFSCWNGTASLPVHGASLPS